MVEVQDGTPERNGLYVAYVNDGVPTFAAKQLLIWDNGEWWLPPGTIKYRDHVYGWVGPLPAMKLEAST